MAAHIAETAIRAFLSEIAGVFNRPEAPEARDHSAHT